MKGTNHISRVASDFYFTMKTYLSWSGGKDSTASIVICYENGIHIDEIVFCEVMFDHKRNISGENPKHIDWVYNIAIPIIEKNFGYKVNIVKSKEDYYNLSRRVITKSKKWNGYVLGFVRGGGCYMNTYGKTSVLGKWEKSLDKDAITILGIAKDEPIRLNRLKGTNRISVLEKFNITEQMTYDICRKYNLLSPLYEDKSRGGCWFCPNQSIESFAKLKKEHPNLWEELRQISNLQNLTTNSFKYEKTFSEVEKQVDAINNQISIYDLIGE